MSDKITILLAGDFIPPENTNNIFSDELKAVLKEKDYSLVNLETPLTNSNKKIEKTGVNFKRPPSTIKHIKNGYFDAVALSNNHIRDYGDKGVLDTIETCNENNIQTVGAGKNIEEAKKSLRLQVKGKKISILNFSEREFNIATDTTAGANPYDTINAFYEINKEKQQNDYVIVVYHGGLEYHNVPLPGIKKRFEFLIEIGADAIISHHTHYISGYSIYKNKPIFYGLGNFYFKYQSKKLLKNIDLNRGLMVKLNFENDDKVTFELIGVIKTEDQLKMNLISSAHDNKSFNSEIDNFSHIINSDINLKQYWQKQYKKYRKKYYSTIKFTNPIIGKIFKKVVSSKMIKSAYLSRVANIINCDAHREILIKSFNKK